MDDESEWDSEPRRYPILFRVGAVFFIVVLVAGIVYTFVQAVTR